MPVSTTVTGMVLSAMPVGDYDKRLVILTKENGKITAFAKGARRPNSALLACCQPFAFGEFSLYPGRTAYNLIAADILNYFGELREDFEGLCYGFYFCEVTDYLTKENNDEKEILKLLYQTLRALAKKTIAATLIKIIYDLKIIALSGEAPQVFECVKCGKKIQKADEAATIYYFHTQSGGLLCDNCGRQSKGTIRIGTSALYTMQYIISKEIEKLYTFKVTDEVQRELERCIGSYLDCYMEHDFKSLEMLKTL